jgi:hypothetical protein
MGVREVIGVFRDYVNKPKEKIAPILVVAFYPNRTNQKFNINAMDASQNLYLNTLAVMG